MSVTSKELLTATGLKTAKTLNRWVKLGIIPEPFIGTHPAGRGKIAYWPDWVLEHCRQMSELVKQGHTHASALTLLEEERVSRLISEVTKGVERRDTLSQKKVRLSDGRKVPIGLLFHLQIAGAVRQLFTETESRTQLVKKLQEAEAVFWGLEYLRNGYAPVCMFDGGRIEVVPDFLVSHILEAGREVGVVWMVIPMLAPIQKVYSALGRPQSGQPLARPAPSVLIEENGKTVECGILMTDDFSFELLRETMQVVHVTEDEA